MLEWRMSLQAGLRLRLRNLGEIEKDAVFDGLVVEGSNQRSCEPTRRNSNQKPSLKHMQPPAELVNQLLTEAREGSQAAVAELLEGYWDYLQGIAHRQLGSKLCGRVSSSDLVQETLLAAWKGFGSFQGTEDHQFSAWLRTILNRKISSEVAVHMGTAKRDISRESDATVGSLTEEVSKSLQSREKDPGEIVLLEEDALIIQRFLANLPEEYRKVIQWRNIDSIRFKEIANRIGKTSGATRLVWLRAMQMLKEMRNEHHDGLDQ